MPNRIDQLVHDARGPLNTISVNAEVAKLLLQKSAPAEAILAAMQNILRECQRCNDILRLISNDGSGGVQLHDKSANGTPLADGHLNDLAQDERQQPAAHD